MNLVVGEIDLDTVCIEAEPLDSVVSPNRPPS